MVYAERTLNLACAETLDRLLQTAETREALIAAAKLSINRDRKRRATTRIAESLLTDDESDTKSKTDKSKPEKSPAKTEKAPVTGSNVSPSAATAKSTVMAGEIESHFETDAKAIRERQLAREAAKAEKTAGAAVDVKSKTPTADAFAAASDAAAAADPSDPSDPAGSASSAVAAAGGSAPKAKPKPPTKPVTTSKGKTGKGKGKNGKRKADTSKEEDMSLSQAEREQQAAMDRVKKLKSAAAASDK